MVILRKEDIIEDLLIEGMQYLIKIFYFKENMIVITETDIHVLDQEIVIIEGKIDIQDIADQEVQVIEDIIQSMKDTKKEGDELELINIFLC